MPGSTPHDLRLVLTAVPPGLAAGLAGLRTPCYLHRTPAWKPRALLSLALVASLAGVGYVLRQVLAGRAGTADWAMGAFLLMAAGLVLRPSSWRPHVSFAADTRGVYFLGTDPLDPPVFVPWAEIGEPTVGHESVGQDGRSRSVILPISDASAFWTPAKSSRFMRHLIGTPDAQGRRGVPIGNAGLRPEDTLEALQAIRASER